MSFWIINQKHFIFISKPKKKKKSTYINTEYNKISKDILFDNNKLYWIN